MQQFVKETLLRLVQAQVEFVVVGGISAVLHGAPILTIDLDISYRRTPPNIARLASALAPLHPKPRGFPPDLPFVLDERTLQLGTNFTLEIEGEDLDLLGEMAAIGGYEDIISRAVEMEVAGAKVKVLPLADLIATKTAAGRPKDLAVLPVLKATLERQRQHNASENEPPASA